MKLTKRLLLSGTLLAGLITGCSSNVTLQAPTIPTPLTDKIPISIGLRMPAEFQHYVHTEEVYGRDEWSIDLGNSNAALFRQLFGHMFDKVTVLKAEDDPALLDIDALIEPSIDAFEFSVPNQSKTDAFAVWIRYRIKVFDSSGDQVASWPVAAYGKSQTASISNSEALQRAAILAMRDAAALMIMKLDEATLISSMAKPPAAASIPATTPVDGEIEAPASSEEESDDDTS
ncbi:MAG: hypothetical protein KJO82_05590 [Gammaproteobacteria bacterium]|nr:hypothetical protein [Gammaproteobacteria bacterium]